MSTLKRDKNQMKKKKKLLKRKKKKGTPDPVCNTSPI